MQTSLSRTLYWGSLSRHISALLARFQEAHYTNAELVTIVCSCRCGLVSGCGKTALILSSCSASWGWASNARNMSRHWTSIKCKWKWSVHQVACVYYGRFWPPVWNTFRADRHFKWPVCILLHLCCVLPLLRGPWLEWWDYTRRWYYRYLNSG
jgi:hypothetical protein